MFTTFAAEGSGIGALGVDFKAFIIQLITFVLAFLVLKRFAFEPIIKLLDERRTTIEAGVSLTEQMRKEKAELDAKVAKELREARAQADKTLSDADAAARDTVRAAEESAAAKAANIVKEGQARGEQEVVRARKALEAELVGLISDATEAIIGEKVDAKKDASLIDRALKEAKA